MNVIKGYHCAYPIHYHIVFPVKYRKALLNKAITKILKQISLDIQDRYGLVIDELGINIDHIHLLCTSHPKYSPGQLVGLYKSITARELFKQFPALKKELWGGEFWTDGYYAGTVSQKGTLETLVTYVKKQGIKPESVQLRLL